MDRLLRQFLMVAEIGSVSLAAEAMNISQPTVTVNMRKLEDKHGVTLLKRSSRGVLLTEYGRILYEHAKVMARLDAQAGAEIRSRRMLDRPSLKVGTGFAWWAPLVEPTLAAFRQGWPEVIVHVEICSSFDGLRHLHSGDVQCFLGSRVNGVNTTAGFTFEKLFEVEDRYFVRQDHPLAGHTIRRRDLKAFPRLDVAPLVNRHFGIVEAPTSVSEPEWSHPLRAPLSTNSVMAGWSILRNSDAYLIYPIAVKGEFEAAGLTVLDVSDRPSETVDIGIYTLKGITQSDVAAAFIDGLKHQDRDSITFA